MAHETIPQPRRYVRAFGPFDGYDLGLHKTTVLILNLTWAKKGESLGENGVSRRPGLRFVSLISIRTLQTAWRAPLIA